MLTVKEIARAKPESLIGRAYMFAEKAHSGQKRKTGEPYFNHAIATAENLLKWRLDETTIAAGLLHDVVEDTPTTREALVKEFGEEVAFLVDGVTKLSHIKYRGAEAKVENLRKMIIAVSKDLRVVFVKLADRMHNMQTLGALPIQKQKRIAIETSEIYAPIANRLGMHEVSGKLQDLAFPYIHPQELRWIQSRVQDEYETRRTYLENLKPELEKVFEVAHLKPVAIDFRAKHYYSLYQKLLRYDMDIAKIYDLVALRVIFETVQDCYGALGIIHQTWPPLPGRIKDYIAMPKANNYRSLHTTIIGPEGKYIEIQLRTKEMHEENEHGIAAHWLYKQTKNDRLKLTSKQVADAMVWVEQIRHWQEQHQNADIDPEDFLKTMKVEFFKDRIFAITPRGDVIDLPAGATVVDFAYQIHTDIGNTCSGGRVNGQLVPLDYELQSGDLVEILIQKNKKPSEDWLQFVKTSMARDHIRAALRMKKQSLNPRRLPSGSEIKIIAKNRLGLLKDVSTIITRSHFHILEVNTQTNPGEALVTLKFRCDIIDRSKIEKLLLKLKALSEVKEVGSRII